MASMKPMQVLVHGSEQLGPDRTYFLGVTSTGNNWRSGLLLNQGLTLPAPLCKAAIGPYHNQSEWGKLHR
jgi:hypothetical protein